MGEELLHEVWWIVAEGEDRFVTQELEWIQVWGCEAYAIGSEAGYAARQGYCEC